ncbi:hypothetical protein SEA_WATERFOUL_27 [Mycobacterium phage Waterfoul]|nr:hypothetical protein SEA_WATERFOUL_27 [Mycobacterium phage Waterfoul]
MAWSLDPLPLPRILIPGWGTVGDSVAVDDGAPGWFSPWTVLAGDTGIGEDIAELNRLRIIVADGGRGADGAAARLRVLAGDAGIGSDRIVTRPRIAVRDAGLGADFARAGVRPADAGSGADLIVVRPRMVVRDAGMGADLSAGLRLRQAPMHMTGVGADFATARFTPRAAVLTPYTTPGTYTYTIPVWCSKIDLVLLGAGGGGASSGTFYALSGFPGAAGQWFIATLTRGVDIPWTATAITIIVGTGGARGSGGLTGTSGRAGESTTAAVPGMSTFIAPGGNGGGTSATGTTNYQGPGPSPQTQTVNGRTFTGGATQENRSTSGNPPGGAGAGGSPFGGAGGAGAAGAAWCVAYQ